MEPKNQKTGKCAMDFYGLIPHFKYNEHLIHLMSFLIGDTLVEGHLSSQTLSITSMLTTFHKLPTCELFSKKKLMW